MPEKKKKGVEIPTIPEFMPHKKHVKIPDFSELRKNKKEKKNKEEKILESKIIDYILSTLLFILLFVAIGYYFSYQKLNEDPFCGGDTLLGRCASTKPYFCEEGVLIERASVCGCPDEMVIREEQCISRYETNPKYIDLKYILRGEEYNLEYIVYGGLVEYIENLPRTISSKNGVDPTIKDFKLRNIIDPKQRELLLPLVIEIQNIADYEEDQLRIAISLVQNIPFGSSNKTVDFRGLDVVYSRYPYEVLYDMEGVCGERSELLAFLLKELGYEVVLFYYPGENHESVGVRCPIEYSLYDTGYCFIETTGPSIITDNEIEYFGIKTENGREYLGSITLDSKPEIIQISEGISLPNNLYEYDDAETWKKIRRKINEKGVINGYELIRKRMLTKKYRLVETYRA